MITVEEYLGQHAAQASDGELTDAIRDNAKITVEKANSLLAEAGMTDGSLRSGWRPAATNAGIPNAAAKSKHMTGQAVDIADEDGALDDFCLAHPEVLESIGLWQEHPASTKGWCHVQIVPPRSGNRVFYP